MTIPLATRDYARSKLKETLIVCNDNFWGSTLHIPADRIDQHVRGIESGIHKSRRDDEAEYLEKLDDNLSVLKKMFQDPDNLDKEKWLRAINLYPNKPYSMTAMPFHQDAGTKLTSSTGDRPLTPGLVDHTLAATIKPCGGTSPLLSSQPSIHIFGAAVKSPVPPKDFTITPEQNVLPVGDKHLSMTSDVIEASDVVRSGSIKPEAMGRAAPLVEETSDVIVEELIKASAVAIGQIIPATSHIMRMSEVVSEDSTDSEEEQTTPVAEGQSAAFPKDTVDISEVHIVPSVKEEKDTDPVADEESASTAGDVVVHEVDSTKSGAILTSASKSTSKVTQTEDTLPVTPPPATVPTQTSDTQLSLIMGMLSTIQTENKSAFEKMRIDNESTLDEVQSHHEQVVQAMEQKHNQAITASKKNIQDLETRLVAQIEEVKNAPLNEAIAAAHSRQEASDQRIADLEAQVTVLEEQAKHSLAQIDLAEEQEVEQEKQYVEEREIAAQDVKKKELDLETLEDSLRKAEQVFESKKIKDAETQTALDAREKDMAEKEAAYRKAMESLKAKTTNMKLEEDQKTKESHLAQKCNELNTERENAFKAREEALRKSEQDFEQAKAKTNADIVLKQSQQQQNFDERFQSLVAREQALHNAEQQANAASEALKALHPHSPTATFTPLPIFDIHALRHGSLLPYSLPTLNGDTYPTLEAAVHEAFTIAGCAFDSTHATQLTDILVFPSDIAKHTDLPTAIHSALNAWQAELTNLCTYKEQWTNPSTVERLHWAMRKFEAVYRRKTQLKDAYMYMEIGRPGMARETLNNWVFALREVRDSMGDWGMLGVCCVEEEGRVRADWKAAGGLGWEVGQVGY